MKLDRHNVEAWLLDRLEGRLTSEQERALDAFLIANPDLAPAEEDLPSLGVDPETFADKEALKRSLPPARPIDPSNVGDFMIARLEGDLTTEGSEELDRFIAAHPEVARTEKLLALARIKAGPASFAQEVLRRSLPPAGLPSAQLLDDFLVARLEGALSREQQTHLDELLAKDAGAARAWTLMQRTRVMADAAVVYPHKTGLKKREAKVIPLWSRVAFRYAAAASIALLLGLAWWLLREGPVASPQMAEEKKEAPAASQNVSPEKQPEMVKEGSSKDRAPALESREHDGTEPDASGPARAKEPVERAPAEQLDRLDPSLAQRAASKGTPVAGEVPDVPISHDQPETPIASAPQGHEAMTLPELFASTVRQQVLEAPSAETHPLDGDDAVAAVDRGLEAVSDGRAGVDVDRGERGRWKRVDLRLGHNLAITASR